MRDEYAIVINCGAAQGDPRVDENSMPTKLKIKSSYLGQVGAREGI